jgi:hypothetical protein
MADKKMTTAVVYYQGRVIEITSYTGGAVPETCIKVGDQETHYWVTEVNDPPELGKSCRCGEKHYAGHDE